MLVHRYPSFRPPPHVAEGVWGKAHMADRSDPPSRSDLAARSQSARVAQRPFICSMTNRAAATICRCSACRTPPNGAYPESRHSTGDAHSTKPTRTRLPFSHSPEGPARLPRHSVSFPPQSHLHSWMLLAQAHLHTCSTGSPHKAGILGTKAKSQCGAGSTCAGGVVGRRLECSNDLGV